MVRIPFGVLAGGREALSQNVDRYVFMKNHGMQLQNRLLAGLAWNTLRVMCAGISPVWSYLASGEDSEACRPIPLQLVHGLHQDLQWQTHQAIMDWDSIIRSVLKKVLESMH